MGINRATIYGWLSRYRDGGWHGLNAKKRGGRHPKLDGKAIKWIYQTVTLKNPLQLRFTFALWTSKMIAQLIKEQFGIKLGKSSVCRLLNQLGLTPQKPIWRAYQQQPKAVHKWLDEEYPKIRHMAKQSKGLIFFADEAGIRSEHHAGTTWAVKGNTPVITSTGARFGLNMISAVSAQGEFRFMVIKGRIGAKHFMDFMKRLIYKIDQKVFLIVDGHPIHKARSVNAFMEKNKDRLQLFIFPLLYSPELNPDKRVLNDVKNNAVGRQVITTPKDLYRSVMRQMRSIQKTLMRVRSYFQNETTKYAA
jgi:transposase